MFNNNISLSPFDPDPIDRYDYYNPGPQSQQNYTSPEQQQQYHPLPQHEQQYHPLPHPDQQYHSYPSQQQQHLSSPQPQYSPPFQQQQYQQQQQQPQNYSQFRSFGTIDDDFVTSDQKTKIKTEDTKKVSVGRIIFDCVLILIITCTLINLVVQARRFYCPFTNQENFEGFKFDTEAKGCGICMEMFSTQKFCESDGFCYKAQDDEQSRSVMNELKNFYLEAIAVMPPDDERTRTLKRRFKIDNNILFEVDPNNPDNLTSYTLNKGAGMGLCIRQRGGDSNLVEMEVIKFVFAHELSHVFTKSYNHTPEFWRNFKWFLSLLYDANVLEPIDFKRTPKKYCGLIIDSNPYFDT